MVGPDREFHYLSVDHRHPTVLLLTPEEQDGHFETEVWNCKASPKRHAINGNCKIEANSKEYNRRLHQKFRRYHLKIWRRWSIWCETIQISHNFDLVDEPLTKFFRLAREQNIPISGEMLLAKAKKYAEETKRVCLCLPDRTHVFKNDKCVGGRHSKEGITVMVSASMAVERFPLLVTHLIVDT